MFEVEVLIFFSSWVMILAGLCSFLALFVISAPYGRYSPPPNVTTAWGFLIPGHLAWFLMESPNLWITVVVFTVSQLHECNECVTFTGFLENGFKSPNIILLACFLSHYFHRSIIYPLRMSHCNSMPVSVMFLAFTFCCWNGFNQSVTLLTIKTYPVNWMVQFQFPIGLCLFVLGAYINISSDYYLLSLKREKERNGVKGYVIPRTGLFEYISCPNYFGEILEWTGFAIACNTLPGYAFAWFTFANLFPRAIKHHQWYKGKFEDYPSSRRAVIPFII